MRKPESKGEMNKEESIFQKHLLDLSNQAYQREIVVFSDFLNLNELNILHTTPKHLFPARYETFGGYGFSERQIAAFLPDALYYEYTYPVQALEIFPANAKFAEELNHRDYLGALMNLGLERCKIGDILVAEKSALIFVKEEFAGFISDSLSRIRHTTVRVSPKALDNFNWCPTLQQMKGTVPSVRLDTVLSVAYPLSRSRLTGYIADAKVFVNGKLTTSNGYHLREGDIISVRGVGRIRYDGILSETKKGRYYISVAKFI